MNPVLRHLLVIDIETISSVRNFSSLNASMQHFWRQKAAHLRSEEGLSPEELFEKKAGIYAEFGQIVAISMGYFHQEAMLQFRTRTLYDSNESALLEAFVSALERFDQLELRLCAHNGSEFDFPYLSRRMIVNELKLPWPLDIAGKKPWEIQHLDTLNLWKFGDRKNFTSLALLCELLGIPTSKQDMDGSMVSEVYYREPDGLERIAKYCRGDVVATAQLFLKLNGLALLADEQITHTDE